MPKLEREGVPEGGRRTRQLLRPPDELVETGGDGDRTPYRPDGKRALRVLIADDDRDAAHSLSRLVNLGGDETRAAYDGAEALEMASLWQPHVLLLDLSMPTMDGCQVARQLRRQGGFGHALLIAVTGWTDLVFRRLCEEAGFDHYLIKPIDLAGLQVLLLQERVRPAPSAGEVEWVSGAGRTSPRGARNAAVSPAGCLECP